MVNEIIFTLKNYEFEYALLVQRALSTIFSFQ